ncbi:pre-mRNA-splicing factor [Raphidocelis subcapitata]|uniref:Pre-mRNA-splicing factor 38 n=1 Tax=Raphidocelis subcapitata TaxID=307507 RepID=A0A2V0PFQ7_9CHLO|nr:pre-mRNA-splicing factor [Raphidocelis subcapitata]|eukprot:GBF98688.1 pre-mRNA-splicing factor [Raphidocelis subcapitata]
MEIYGNPTTFNLETVLKQNITACDYYRNDCTRLTDWQAVVDEIYNAVSDIEPWIGGNARGPSSAFCLLHRLFTLRLSVEEITATINHADSPFIRALGFLYLRYVCDPRNLWNWFKGYVEDKEEIRPTKFAGNITMGEFCRDLLLEQYYFETIFPRIPKKVQDDIIAALTARGLPTTGKGNAGTGGPDRRGADEGNRRPASVKASLSVAMGQKAPNRAGTKDFSVREALWEEKMGGRGGGGRGGGGRDGGGRDGGRDGERGERGGDERGGGRERDRDRDWDRGGGGRERGGGGGGGVRDYRDRDRDWERERSGRGGGGGGGGGRDYDRGGGRGEYRERGGGDYRGGGGGGGGGGRDYRDRGRERSPDRRRFSRSPERRRYSRSRSRSPARYGGGGGGGGGGRDARDVFRDAAADAGAAGGDVRSRYGDANGSRLFDEGGGGYRGGRGGEEVYRLGARKGGGYR